MIHVYGVVDGLAELPPVAGLEDAPLERRRVETLEVVLSRAQTPPSAQVSRDAVLRHAQVVEALAARSAAILPAQLGHAFRDEDELETAVRSQAQQLARGLERVRGCVEFGLRAIPAEGDDEVEAGSGAEYMRARLEQVRRHDGLVARLHEPLARVARAATVRPQNAELNAAYLVAREDVGEFRATVARLERAPDLTVVCTGPWPPYSFATEEER
ncbi:MAG: GvpL/GvpF family gas vesicle protein [Gaiellaceae bacterium]